jgi:MYXO-CTERM domain-containing protein
MLAMPVPAEACGGTFCDGAGPPGVPPMPVDQTGENVLFVMQDGMVEAHIQIQYQGDPARFAWVIPVPVKPEIEVGSQLLFLNLLNGSVPQFTLTTTFDFCGSNGSSSSQSGGCGMSASDDGAASSFGSGGSGGAPQNDTPFVSLRDSVGNFEVVVLEPTTVQGLVDWLTLNQFLPDDEAPPVLEDYLNRGYVFVAVKLQASAGVDEIHPLVIRYPGTEPCVPLKLTRIAATEDMRVRTFFLGEYRVMPTGGYKHVEINPARFDFVNLGQNYNLAVARAVDAPIANGRAFMTEYAGSSGVISQDGLFSPSWSSVPFETAAPIDVVTLLAGQGLLTCSTGSCTSPHPLVLPLLRRYLPAPAGVFEDQFYGCLSCYADEIDLTAWSAAGFAADFEELIVVPGQRAVEVLSTYPYLTRMLTAISPSEMTEDPMFLEWKGEPLPDVAQQRTATQRTRCDGNVALELSDGRAVPLPGTGVPPNLPVDMPWASRVEEFTSDGQHLVLVDESERLDQQVETMQDDAGWSDLPPGGEGVTESGCACSVASRSTRWGIGTLLFAALALLRRRGRQSSEPRRVRA